MKIDPFKLVAKRVDPFRATEKIKVPKVRNRMLDVLLNVTIPFNRWLGLRLLHVSDEKVVVVSPPTTLRKNHVGSAHACALALMGEYASGLLVAQHYTVEKYRVIIGNLNVEYKKQGRGTLVSTAVAPEHWTEIEKDEAWVEMRSEITDKTGEAVAICTTKWQVKPWDAVKT